jgi:8-oxo-dGTP pyrophosphatase MutT (NUDIX family)
MSDRPRPWRVLGRRTIYTSPWVNLHRDDIELPDGSLIDGHHVVDIPFPAVAVVPVGPDGRILLIEHYRFIPDTFEWELPAGGVDPHEDPAVGAARELREEAGAVAEQLEYLGMYHPMNGNTNGRFYLYVGHGVRQDGQITDTNEVLSSAWFEPADVWAMIERNEIHDGLTLTGLLWHFARRESQEPGTKNH